ncbi:MAG: ketopantoate reductase family protein [Chloroflexota bacterium]
MRILRECFSVPRALGVEIKAPPESPWKIADWLEGPGELALDGLREIGERQRAAGGDVRPSMLQDVLAARRTEAVDVIGPLLDRAERRGIQLPATETAYRLVRGLEDGALSSTI